MLKTLRRKLFGGGDFLAPPAPPPIDWMRYHLLNTARRAKGAQPITPDEWVTLWRESMQAKQPERKYTRAELKRLNDYLIRTGREPLSMDDQLEMEGISVSELQDRATEIENAYQAAKAANQRKVNEWITARLPVPADAAQRLDAEARAARDVAITALRADALESFNRVRESHSTLRDEARRAAYPRIDADTESYLSTTLARDARTLDQLARIYKDTQSAAGKLYLESHGADFLASETDKLSWQLRATEGARLRAADPLARMAKDEGDIMNAVSELNKHPLMSEAQNMASIANTQDSEQFLNMPVGLFKVDAPPDPVL